jgi:hypothetical protein
VAGVAALLPRREWVTGATLAITLACASVGMTGCEQTRGRVGGEVVWNDPSTPGSPQRATPVGSLPSSHSRTRNKTVRVLIDGEWYSRTVCVASDPSDDECVYMNDGECSSSEGWYVWCKPADGSSQDLIEPDGADAHLEIADTPAQPAASTPQVARIRNVTPSVSLNPPLSTQADISFDVSSRSVSVSVESGPAPRIISPELIDVTITSPSGISLPSDIFSIAYQGFMPPGSIITFEADVETAAWNASILGIRSLSGDTEGGHRIGAAIKTLNEGFQIWMITFDGVVVDSGVVHRPN